MARPAHLSRTLARDHPAISVVSVSDAALRTQADDEARARARPPTPESMRLRRRAAADTADTTGTFDNIAEYTTATETKMHTKPGRWARARDALTHRWDTGKLRIFEWFSARVSRVHGWYTESNRPDIEGGEGRSVLARRAREKWNRYFYRGVSLVLILLFTYTVYAWFVVPHIPDRLVFPRELPDCAHMAHIDCQTLSHLKCVPVSADELRTGKLITGQNTVASLDELHAHMVHLLDKERLRGMNALHMGIQFKWCISVVRLNGEPQLLINPRIMPHRATAHVQSSEKSLFCPDRGAITITRETSIKIAHTRTNGDVFVNTFDGSDAIGLYHLVEQLGGTSICDEQ